MTMSVDLPVVRLEPPRARIATFSDVAKDTVAKYPRSVGTAWNAISHGHASDHKSAQLSDSLRTASVALIAGLGSLGVSQTGGFLPFVLGGLSWLGAMAITPKVLNGMAYLKTGINQNMRYVTSNNDVRPLFQDPNFLPMQVIPQDLRLHWAEHLGIDRENPDRPALLKDKLKQLTIQTHTWWMTVAGIATPVLSALICDNLETPLRNLMIDYRVGKAKKQFDQAVKSGVKGDIEFTLRQYVQTVVGHGTDMTPVARWWGKMQSGMGKMLHLQGVDAKTLIKGSSAQQFDAVADHLVSHLKSKDVRVHLGGVLQGYEAELQAFLDQLKEPLAVAKQKHIAPALIQELEGAITMAQSPAKATLLQLQKLTKPTGPVKTLKSTMEKPVIAIFERLFTQSKYDEARKLAGSEAQYQKLVDAMAKDKQMYTKAFAQLGASPKDLLINTARSLALRNQWLRRYPIAIGGTALAASVLFVGFFLGKDFGNPATGSGGNNE